MMDHNKIETVDEFLKRYEERAKIDGRAAYFLTRAYVSWYRPAEVNNCNLYEFNQLDHDDRELFLKMLRLRESSGWRDQLLLELEQRLIEHWKIGENEPEENTRRVELQTGEDDLDPDD